MLTIVLISIFVFVSVFIFGIGVNRLTEYAGLTKNQHPPSIDTTFFFGLATLLVVCGWLSLISPINEYALLVLFFLTLFVVGAEKKRIAHYLPKVPSSRPALFKIILVLSTMALFILLALDFSFMGIIYYDTGLYHTQSIEWIRNYSVVPGLGNLHDRLAFNSMVFPLNALFTFFPDKWLVLPLNFVVFAVVAGRLVWNSYMAISHQKSGKAVFYVIILGLLIGLNVRQIYAVSTDLFSGLLVLYLLIIIFEKKSDEHHLNFSDLLAILLMMVSVTVKLSTAPILLLLFYYFKDFNRKQLIAIAVMGILVFSPFLIRNYILSGYLIYPFPSLDLFNPDWKVPLGNVSTTKDAITAWAKVPRVDSGIVLDMSVSQWLPMWWEQLKLSQQLLIVANIIALPVLAVQLFFKSMKTKWFHFTLLVYLIFWFFTAPDPRFATGVLIFNTAYLAFLLIPQSLKINKKILNSALVFAVFYWMVFEYQVIIASIKTPNNWIVPRSAVKIPELTFVTTNFTFAVPVSNNQCHSAPIPCTPYPKENLVLRNSSLSSGFKIETRQPPYSQPAAK